MVKAMLARLRLAPARARYKYSATLQCGRCTARSETGAMRKFLTVRINVNFNVAACIYVLLLIAVFIL